MRQDWIWGCAAILPALIVSLVAIGSIGQIPETPWIAHCLILFLTALISTGALYIKNRHSLRRIARSGGEVELMIRIPDALEKAAIIFFFLLGVIAFTRLISQRDFDGFEDNVAFSAVFAYITGLVTTAYRREAPEGDGTSACPE